MYAKISFLILMWFLLVSTACRVQKPADDVLFEAPVDTKTKPVDFQTRKTWKFDKLSFSNEFPGARLNEVREINDSCYELFIRPENYPINPSPWYAFKTWSSRQEDQVEITLNYGTYTHRYAPVISNGQLANNLASNDSTFRFKFSLSQDTVLVSAQKPETSSDVRVWTENFAKTHGMKVNEYGKSKNGRPLFVAEYGNKNLPAIVVLCRQHPPEVTGYTAMQAFMAALFDQGKDFFEKYRVLVFPLLNPDGVDEGHWRHNAGGVDLNRDWSVYEQPEIRQTVDYINSKCNKGKNPVVLALDFHSTYHDVFYINQEDSTQVVFPGLKDQWLDSIKSAFPSETIKISPSAPKTPVSKNWFYKYYGAVALTYEIGDDTPPELIRAKGRVSAIELMKLLQTEKAASQLKASLSKSKPGRA